MSEGGEERASAREGGREAGGREEGSWGGTETSEVGPVTLDAQIEVVARHGLLELRLLARLLPSSCCPRMYSIHPGPYTEILSSLRVCFPSSPPCASASPPFGNGNPLLLARLLPRCSSPRTHERFHKRFVGVFSP